MVIGIFSVKQGYLPEFGSKNQDLLTVSFTDSLEAIKCLIAISIPRKSACNRKCYSEQTWWPLDNSQLLVEGERDGPELGLVHFEVFFVE